MDLTDIDRSVGARIRARRTHLELSQERLAALAGMDRTAVGKIERGERGVTVGTLFKLARALRTTMSDLLEDVR